MSIITDIYRIQKTKEVIDSIRNNEEIQSDDKYKLSTLEEQISKLLSNMFCIYNSSNVFSNSFSKRISEIENKIYELINQKNILLSNVQEKKDILNVVTRDILTILYSIELVENNVSLCSGIDKRLLDLKNNIINVNTNKKKECALTFIENKLPIYIENLKKLMQIIYDFPDKLSLPFEKRQEIFELISDISISTQIDKSHSKMFNEDLNTNDTDTLDYVKWYENIFLETCNTIGLNLTSYYTQFYDFMYNPEFSINSLLSYIEDFISKKYFIEVKLYHQSMHNYLNKSYEQISMQISSCFSFKEISNSDSILWNFDNINSKLERTFDFKYVEILKKIIENKKVNIKDASFFNTICEKLSKLIIQNFDYDDYLNIYYANSKYKTRQIDQFTNYYTEVLETSKLHLINEYKYKIEEIIETKLNEDEYFFNIDENCKNINEEIESLNESLEYINLNYRTFNEDNFKIYLKNIEKIYGVTNLYENVIIESTSLFHKLKIKRILKNDLPYIENFINSDEIKDSLRSLLIDLIIPYDNLRSEIKKI